MAVKPKKYSSANHFVELVWKKTLVIVILKISPYLTARQRQYRCSINSTKSNKTEEDVATVEGVVTVKRCSINSRRCCNSIHVVTVIKGPLRTKGFVTVEE